MIIMRAQVPLNGQGKKQKEVKVYNERDIGAAARQCSENSRQKWVSKI